MKYENPQLPEDINYSRDNPLPELLILLGGALAIAAVLAVALALGAGWLARQIPFAVEQRWAAGFAAQLPAEPVPAEEEAARRRLQTMVDRIAVLQALPADMKPVMHIIDGRELNAFATLGGHLFITRGMLEKVASENALVTVLAHEVAHIKYRDPVVALGRGVAVMTALGVLGGFDDGGLVANQMQGAGLLTTLSFNREQERRADAEALATLQGWYGYTAGGAELFELLQTGRGAAEPPALFNTHPGVAERIARMEAAATPGPRVPVPAEIGAWLRATETSPPRSAH